MINNKKLAVDRYPHPPTDNQVVVPLSLDSPFDLFIKKGRNII